jgi:hypothetical protein
MNQIVNQNLTQTPKKYAPAAPSAPQAPDINDATPRAARETTPELKETTAFV